MFGLNKERVLVIITGVVAAIGSIILVLYGNPANMGLCVACFIRDTAGALGLHHADVVQYVRPEIIGLVLGAFIVSLISREFSPGGGSSPVTRFILGFCVMVGALVFLGCPIRMMLRIGGGDLNAVVGLVGFIAGIAIGVFFLNKGFSLKRAYKLSKVEGLIYPALNLTLLVVLCVFPIFLLFSQNGPGSMHAPIILSLAVGTIVGGLAQKSRFCTLGGIRDTIMFRDTLLLSGLIAMVIVTVIGNLYLGNFHLGFEKQPIAHSDGLWNFLSMLVVGFGSALLGGCPLRQLILSGSGNGDSTIAIFGLFAGAAFSHNFKLASSPEGPSPMGPTAVIICFIVIILIAIFNIKRKKES